MDPEISEDRKHKKKENDQKNGTKQKHRERGEKTPIRLKINTRKKVGS